MTARQVFAAAVATLTLAACAPEAPDYQAVWSTTSAPSPSPQASNPSANPSGAPVPIAAFLEQNGVTGQPVAYTKVTDLTVTMPTPPGWHPYQNTNLSPGTRMIVKGDTYPTAMLIMFELTGNFDIAQALTHANVDAQMSQNFRQLNASTADFGGFPSSMIEGSYDLNESRMHSYNRIVIATGAAPKKQRYLIQFTVTGYAEKAAEEAGDIEAVIRGFTVKVPTPPAR
ncbi:LpqN/LpqT family lipoprotein [Mycolicibacterium obuense]|uniref:Lipoprotein LpqT n=1 Tax=Mycolicibacterium obuense TaxID=1807 RepID=A0A0J6YSY1_9MYCO|nr:LpqN/LpqT family lipoprotein [Mycolicibacterium obuense]KKF03164.1 lipoprotein LpqT [Mycolicibacterium obuense]KMO75626.1 putative lipoprotein LpqN [Mycolicibacterium obuense]